MSKALNKRCCQQNFTAFFFLLTTSTLRFLMGYSHTKLKESVLKLSKQHWKSIKSCPNAQHTATTKIQCYCYVQMAGAVVLLQLRYYWANCQHAAASRVPNKCLAGNGQQENAGSPNVMRSMLMTNIQALFDDVMLTMTI